jgi:hypothetical protein
VVGGGGVRHRRRQTVGGGDLGVVGVDEAAEASPDSGLGHCEGCWSNPYRYPAGSVEPGRPRRAHRPAWPVQESANVERLVQVHIEVAHPDARLARPTIHAPPSSGATCRAERLPPMCSSPPSGPRTSRPPPLILYTKDASLDPVVKIACLDDRFTNYRLVIEFLLMKPPASCASAKTFVPGWRPRSENKKHLMADYGWASEDLSQIGHPTGTRRGESTLQRCGRRQSLSSK